MDMITPRIRTVLPRTDARIVVILDELGDLVMVVVDVESVVIDVDNDIEKELGPFKTEDERRMLTVEIHEEEDGLDGESKGLSRRTVWGLVVLDAVL
ncbi:hypothetical protein D9758_010675 [Tetrapyrgos nigripes]|uniref:Uncharacterized protein n=1 Tax=Tetrapyrgos nigripes TaxID=182062 RepID=A0A8H5GGL6_9AGAR|nr:hypothetical protein D9758_010675 [Tetrapyrgos nigripes]